MYNTPDKGKSFKLILFLNLVLVSIIPGNLLSQNIFFEHLNRDNGMPVNSVTCVTQDKDGFMWMGSHYGLVKYDGINFKLFQYNSSDQFSLPGHQVTNICTSKNGLIYLSVTKNGLSILDPATEKFLTFKPGPDNNLESNNITAILEDSIGNFWIGSNNGLYYFNATSLTFKRYKFNSNTNEFGDYISDLIFDDNKNLYILGYRSSLIHFSTTDFSYQELTYTNKLQESVFLFNAGALYLSNDNKLWIGTENNGVFIYDLTGIEETKHLLPDYMISSIKNIDGNIWVATDGHGLRIFTQEGKVVEILLNDPYDDYTLGSNGVYCIYESDDHTIWVGNYATGVNLYNASGHKFRTYNDIGKTGERLTNKSVLSLLQMNDSALIVGTDGGGLNILNLFTKKILPLKSQNNKLDNIVAKSLCINDNNSFYLGTYGQGLFYCDYLTDGTVKARKINRDHSDRKKHVWSLYKASDTVLWAGYLNSGLSLYNPETNVFRDIPEFEDINILVIKEINNEIWLSAEQEGIFICDKTGKILRHFQLNTEVESSLGSNHILNIYVDKKNAIWLGTATGGLNKVIDSKQGIFERMNSQNKLLPTNLINNITEDSSGNFWLSSDMGVIRFNFTDSIYNLYDKKDGLQGKNYNNNACFNNNNETIYIGGVDGISFFKPDLIKPNNVKPRITFTGLLIGNKKVEIDEAIHGRTIYTKPFPYVKKIELSYKDEDFTIEFAALYYESPSKNQYKYKLEGFDQDWKICKPGQPWARYTNLRKGNFVFKVIASNADNVWNVSPIELAISIKPAFYNTAVFYILVSVLVILLVVLYIKWHTDKLNRDKEKLEMLVEERTRELKVQADTVIEQNEEITSINNQIQEYNKLRDRIYSIIAHDLKSPLGAVISFSHMLQKDFEIIDTDSRKKFINIIWQTATKMNSLIVNLIYWVNNQVNKINFVPKDIEIKEIFSEVQEITEGNALQKEIILTFNSNNTKVFADYELLVIVVRNLVSNSIKFTGKNGIINVDAESKNGKTTITVSDNGVGMTKEQMDIIDKNENLQSTTGTDNESGTGLGLLLCKDFTEINHGEFLIESKPGKGTRIQVILPA